MTSKYLSEIRLDVSAEFIDRVLVTAHAGPRRLVETPDMVEFGLHTQPLFMKGISMSEDEMVYFVAFQRAEIFPMPEHGFIGLALHHWEQNGSDMEVRAGLPHRLTKNQVEDLIGHMKKSLDQFDNSTATAAGEPTRH
jgi:hypothetical protein